MVISVSARSRLLVAAYWMGLGLGCLGCDGTSEPSDLGPGLHDGPDGAVLPVADAGMTADAESQGGDAEPEEVGADDSGPDPDLGAHEDVGGPADAEALDLGAADASSATDLGEAADAESADAEPPDLGAVDGGATDAAPSDAGVADSGGPASPCGNGVLDGTEACDDGNLTPLDGCSADCRQEIPYNCTGQPSICVLGPLLGSLAAGTSVTFSGGPLAPGAFFLHRLELSESLILVGELFRPANATTGDLDFDLLEPAQGSTWNVAFSSAEFGNESFTTPVLAAGSYAVLVSTWSFSGAVASYTLRLRAHAPAGCGNGLLGPGEECDDGNSVSGDGCSATCALELGAAWTCNPASYGGFDGCDCGCGLVDPDCDDATAASCLYCSGGGSCNSQPCPGTLVSVNNAVCR